MSDSEQPRDHAPEEEYGEPMHQSEERRLEDHIKSRSTWLRLVFMILFVAIWGLSRFIVGAVVILQFLWVLLSGERNPRLTDFGQSLATYTYEIVMYLTFNTERRPFPFAQWPAGPPSGSE